MCVHKCLLLLLLFFIALLQGWVQLIDYCGRCAALLAARRLAGTLKLCRNQHLRFFLCSFFPSFVHSFALLLQKKFIFSFNKFTIFLFQLQLLYSIIVLIFSFVSTLRLVTIQIYNENSIKYIGRKKFMSHLRWVVIFCSTLLSHIFL